MKHILALTDFSSISEAAVDAAFRFANQYNADLTIFHQLIEGELLTLDLSASQELATVFSSEMAAIQSLQKWKQLAAQYGVSAKCKLSADPLSTSIAQFTTDIPTDLILMGATGFGQRADDYYWGSHTQMVVNSVDAPVLIVNQPIEALPFKNIVFASSFDQKEKEVFYFFLDLIDPHPDAIIHLLSIDTTNYFSQPTIIVQEAMRDFAKLALGRKTRLHFYENASISAGIQNFSSEIEADFLVMSHKFDKPLRHLFRGDRTLKTIDQARVPVLTLDYPD